MKTARILCRACADEYSDAHAAIVHLNEHAILTMRLMRAALVNLKETIPDIYKLRKRNYSAAIIKWSEKIDDLTQDKEKLQILPEEIKTPDETDEKDKIIQYIDTNCNKLCATISGYTYFTHYHTGTGWVIETISAKIEDWEKMLNDQNTTDRMCDTNVDNTDDYNYIIDIG